MCFQKLQIFSQFEREAYCQFEQKIIYIINIEVSLKQNLLSFKIQNNIKHYKIIFFYKVW